MFIHVPPEVPVLAMDVHKNTISVGVLEAGSTAPVVDKISSDDEAVGRLIARAENPTNLSACYEARGPDRLRTGPPSALLGYALRGDRPVVDPVAAR